jgi:WD40 repeat protein
MFIAARILSVGIGAIVAGTILAAEPRPLVELPLGEKASLSESWLEFSPDGRWLAAKYNTSSRLARVRVWSRTDWKAAGSDFEMIVGEWTGPGPLGAAFDAKGDTLYFISDGQLYSLGLPVKAPPSKTKLRLSDPRSARQVVSLDSNRTLIASTGGWGADTFGVYRVPLGGAGDPTKLFAGKWSQLDAATASRDGSRVAVGFTVNAPDEPDHMLEVWDAGGKQPRFRRERLRGEVWVAKFSPDGKVLAVGGDDGMVTVWDADGGRLVRSWTEDYSISSIDFHPTRPVLAYTVRDGHGKPNLRVADISTGKVLASLRPDPSGCLRVRFSQDGKCVAALGACDTVRVWDVESLIGK